MSLERSCVCPVGGMGVGVGIGVGAGVGVGVLTDPDGVCVMLVGWAPAVPGLTLNPISALCPGASVRFQDSGRTVYFGDVDEEVNLPFQSEVMVPG